MAGRPAARCYPGRVLRVTTSARSLRYTNIQAEDTKWLAIERPQKGLGGRLGGGGRQRAQIAAQSVGWRAASTTQPALVPLRAPHSNACVTTSSSQQTELHPPVSVSREIFKCRECSSDL
ncbi:hypothetical protein RR48_07651 [Papilio machaon]|uniref:Uncharacterized protein n=1 Tax=Papilio machaon TaxID=76193 RepID=A0A194QQI8_PAPMA|nr:hypothetical protein RR48_07651 [Papilio machaon]